jgi:hypothetical protein
VYGTRGNGAAVTLDDDRSQAVGVTIADDQ